MRTRTLSALLVSTALLPAQGRCPAPNHLATQEPFIATHYYNVPGANSNVTPPIPQNLPAGYRGFLLLCDLTAATDIDIDQIDVRLTDDGSTRFTWGPAPGVPGGTGLVGHHAVANIYTTAGTWSGTWNTANGPVAKILVPPGAGSPWTLAGTGTLTVRTRLEHSPIHFHHPLQIPAGTCGFLIEVGPVTDVAPNLPYQQPPYALHPSLLLPAFAPGAQMGASDQFVTLANLDILNQAFAMLPLAQVKSPVFDIHYEVSPSKAYYNAVGAGCYDRPGAIYEVFEPAVPTNFDLSNTAFRMTPNGDAYAVTATAATIVPPVSPPLTNAANAPLGDDARTGVLALGFSFPYSGGSTSSIVVTTNGNIFLDPANSGAQQAIFEPFDVAGFLKGQPQVAAMWSDLDPSLGGSMHLDVDLSAAVPVAYVTWLNVAEWYTPGSSNTVQIAMYANGVIEYRYGACSITKSRTLVGFNPGWSPHDPGARDLSASLPFSTGDGTVPPALTMDARPVIGTTPNLVLSDLPADATGVLMLGIGIRGFDLGWLGMPGCVQQVLPLRLSVFQATGSTATLPLWVPGNGCFLGARLNAQAFVTSPGSNAAGRTISNALCIKLGR